MFIPNNSSIHIIIECITIYSFIIDVKINKVCIQVVNQFNMSKSHDNWFTRCHSEVHCLTIPNESFTRGRYMDKVT